MLIILTKFHNDWIKFVDFFLKCILIRCEIWKRKDLYNYKMFFFIQKPLLASGMFGALALSGLAFSQSHYQKSRIASLESLQNTLNTLKSRQDSLCSSVSKSEIHF